MNNLETLKLGKTEKVLLRAKGNKSVTAVLKVVALGKKKKVRTSFTDPSLGIKNKGRYIVYSDSFKEAKVKLSDWESDQLAGEFGDPLNFCSRSCCFA